MRHLGSVALAALLTPVILVLAGRGVRSLVDATADGPDVLASATALAALGLAGMLYAALVLPRLSPLGLLLGAGIAGGAFAPSGFEQYFRVPLIRRIWEELDGKPLS